MASTQVTAAAIAPPKPTRGTAASGKTRVRQSAPATVEDLDDDALEIATEPEEPARARVFRGKDGEDFFDWLSGFSTDEWQHMMGYLYRTAPTIDRRAAGRPTNIRKYSDFFDQDRVMHDEGSGGYRMDLCQRDPASGKSQRIAQVYFQIMNLDFPPRVPAGDWVDQPENDVWKWAKPALERAAAIGYLPQQQPEVNAKEMFATILEGVKSLRGNDGEKGDSVAAATIAQFGGMLQALLNKPVPVADNSASLTIITFLQHELTEQRKEVRAMRDQMAAQQPRGILEQIKEIVPAVTQVVEIMGLKRGGGKAAETNWGDVITEVVDKLSNNAPMIYELWRNGKNADATPAGAGGFRLPAGKKDEPAAQSQAATPAEAKQQEDNLSQEKRDRYKTILTKWGKLIEGVAPFLVDNFRRSKTGYDFRDWFIEAQGMNNYAAFRLEVSAQELTELTQLHSYLAGVMQPPDKVMVFFTEFLTEPGDEPPGIVTETEE